MLVSPFCIATKVAGGIIVLALYKLSWEPVKCSEAFDKLSLKMFGTRKSKTSMFSSFKRLVKGWVADGVHDAENLESALKDTFGADDQLFGDASRSLAGSKYAVIAASISDASPFVLSNYNGAISRNKHSGELLRQTLMHWSDNIRVRAGPSRTIG